MRLVRFHLEPWQKGGSVASSPSHTPTPNLIVVSPNTSLLVLNPSQLNRQRPPDINDIQNIEKIPREVREKRLQKRLKHRYPKMVQRLSSICSDVLARHVFSPSLSLSLLSLILILS